MSTLVSIRNLHKTYQRGPEKVDVLRGIDLDITEGTGHKGRSALIGLVARKPD